MSFAVAVLSALCVLFSFEQEIENTHKISKVVIEIDLRFSL
jgi:hypothetical protein